MVPAPETPTGASPAGASILARTARGAGWMVAWRMGTRLLGLASTLVLVRLLAPEDFGLVALAAAFATALDACLSFGLEDQIVRVPAPDRALYDTAFTINLLRGLVVAVILVATSGAAASFFGDPRLGPVLIALAAITAVSGLGNIGCTDFRREMAFDKEFRLMMLPRLLGSAVTVSAAFLLHSHWALLAGIATGRVAGVVLGYRMHPYRPRLSLRAGHELLGISFWTWALNVAELLRERADTMVIGRVLGSSSVGIYGASLEVAALPTSELVLPIGRACMPGFAEALRSEGDVAGNFLRIIALTALLTLPAGIGISLVAGPVVALGFGQAWLEAVPVIQLLGATFTLAVFGAVSFTLLVAYAMLRSLFFIVVSVAVLRIGLLVALVGWLGLIGAAIAVAVSYAAEASITTAKALRHLKLAPAALLGCVWRPLLAAAVMALVLWSAGLGWALAPAAEWPAARALLAGVTLGAASYLAALGSLWAVCGRPEGAETDMLTLGRRLLGPFAARFRRGALAGRVG